MHKAAAPRINAHVIDVMAADPEKDEVAWRQCVGRDRARRTPLRSGGTGNLHTRFFVGVDRKPATVEPVQIGSAEMVGNTDELRSGLRNEHATISRWLIGLAR